MTDQNWQGQAHARLENLLAAITKALRPTMPVPSFASSAVYKINLVTINDPSEGHASWVEANGVKRYCVGPGSGKDNRGCDKRIVRGRDYP